MECNAYKKDTPERKVYRRLPAAKDLYGEIEIYRISEDLKEIWSFSAADIFVRCGSNESAFEMKNDRICLYDFLDNYYEIDYDGNIITEIMKEHL